MPACFERCQPGMLYDMACHDLAIAVGRFGLSVAGYADLTVNEAASLQATHCGIQDFVRLDFSLRPTKGAPPIRFVIDRQAGAFNGIEVNGRRFLSGESPLSLPDLSPHLAVQYDYYVEAKRILLAGLAAVSPSAMAAVKKSPAPACEMQARSFCRHISC